MSTQFLYALYVYWNRETHKNVSCPAKLYRINNLLSDTTEFLTNNEFIT